MSFERQDAVLIQQASHGVAAMLELTMMLHSQFCRRHNIDYWPIFGLTGEDEKGGGWEKNRLIMRAFEAGYRYVIFLDLDCLILPTCPDLREGVPPGAIGCVWHDADWSKHDPTGQANLYDHHNIGAIYLDKTPLTEHFLHAWWETDPGSHCWGNQHAFKLVVKEWNDKSDVVAPVVTISRDWNSTPPHPGENPKVLAWHGIGNLAERYAMMQQAVQQYYGGMLAETPPPIPQQATSIQQAQEAEERGIWEKAINFRTEGEKLRGQGNAEGCKALKEQSAETYRHLLNINPLNVAAWSQYGVLQTELRNHAESLRAFDEASRLDPNVSQFWHGLGFSASFLGMDELAYEANEQCLRLTPSMPTAQWNKSNILLAQGNYREGWELYQWGMIAQQRPVRTYQQPIQPNDPIMNGVYKGKTILVWPEQGMGDNLMFARFLPELKKRTGAKIILELPHALLPIMKNIEGADWAYVSQPDNSIPVQWDEHTSLASLPWLLQLNDEDDYRRAPYIHADPHKVECWNKALGQSGEFRIGIAWKGSITHANDPHRSIVQGPNRDPSDLWQDLAGSAGDGVKWVALDPDHNRDLRNWTDTAAAIANLDLVICVDTSVAHLAGAMGIPVWMLISTNNDWRWLRGKETTHWYDSVRLYRQSKIDEWKPVFECIKQDLANLLQSRKPKPSLIIAPPPGQGLISLEGVGKRVDQPHEGILMTRPQKPRRR